ncbi:MAG: hydantoinase/oxoprolinase family protein [Pirellulales bacterium]
MSWLALDIGGAHLKLADGAGYAQCVPFPLWQKHRQLAETLKNCIQAAPPCERIAVTMTGELADCFTTRSEGVHFILGAVTQAAEQRKVRVYLVSGRLEKVAAAQREPLAVAAANWHALANFAGRYAPAGFAMLIDVGSTTIDLIPLLDGARSRSARPISSACGTANWSTAASNGRRFARWPPRCPIAANGRRSPANCLPPRATSI